MPSTVLVRTDVGGKITELDRRREKTTRRTRGASGGLCARYWSDTLANTCLLPAARPPTFNPPLAILSLHHALADAQHELDLEARHRLSLRRTRPSSSPRSRVSSLHPEASLHSEAVQRALRAVGVRSHTGTVFHCRMRQPRARLRAAAAMATLQFGLIWTADDGTCADNLFLRSRVCICDLGAFAQPRVHTRMGSAPALCASGMQAGIRPPPRALMWRVPVHGPQSGHVSSHQSLRLYNFLLHFFSERTGL